ncbi:MAG: hypothetical protein IJ773_13230 [Lachnospiraceae bacterium]|nr:hypothetical protein [Lachnospiraceae bacterium]
MTLIDAINPDWCNENDIADLTILRKCIKNILYTVSNSNALNGEVDHYTFAWWKILIIILDCIVVAGIGIWGFFAVREYKKSQKETR